MCLVKSESAARTSSLPVKVYKILQVGNRSPYQYQEYHHGINWPGSIQYELPKSKQNIEGGYLHAYATWDAAVRAIWSLTHRMRMTGYDFKITEMYIPPETEYWLGAADEIAAKELDWPENAEEWHTDSLDYSPVIDLIFGPYPQ